MKKCQHRTTGRKLIPESLTFTQSQSIFIPLFFADPTIKRQIVWELKLENGQQDYGKIKRNALHFKQLPNGKHRLIIIVGDPILSKRHKIHYCQIEILP
ncbi:MULTISPECIES: hypothetical protein [Glaesserella]|uniref:Uncharacterized protein n=1 Tax=Glaesserella australis TaxID=2094024 RepID=A0A328C012_9PAST|nr:MULTISPECIES: hypothetical protein [Glaesserella]AUI65444.1 hypothetical protein CJD39_02100 [Glaesserella sp. 15-184]RAL19639.1 hypothetical protein C5N92_01185 [Glaesserella australis]